LLLLIFRCGGHENCVGNHFEIIFQYSLEHNKHDHNKTYFCIRITGFYFWVLIITIMTAVNLMIIIIIHYPLLAG